MSETKHISLKNLQAFLKPLMRIINRKAESWEDLKNKPFGSTFVERELTDKLRLLADEQWMTLGNFYFVEGRKYTVVFDDVVYDCMAYRDDYGTVDVGDITLVGDSHPKSQDVPFFIYSDMDYGAAIFVEDNSVDHSILITGISETITKLPSKYVDIPNNILTEDNYLRITAGMQKGNGEVFNNYGGNYAYGYMSHAEGSGTWADGEYSHAEGLRTTAAGEGSHAEGDRTTASGENSHAEGYNTEASGLRAHAEGNGTVASENCSHAEGLDTTATGIAQHVQGIQNIADSKYAHIVGNGDYEASGLGGMKKYYSNAHTLDWGGNAWFAGNVYVGSISGRYQDDGSKKLATEEYIDVHATSETAHSDLRDSIAEISALVGDTAVSDQISEAMAKIKVQDNIILRDQVNGLTYIVSMRNGNLVSTASATSINVTFMPAKTEYIHGEYFDPTGMIVTAVCVDGTTKEIDDYIFTKDFLVNGITNIEIRYEEAGITHKASVPITVRPFDPSEILIDFTYTTNSDGTYTITGWNGTYNGKASTEIIVPNNACIVV